jgi:osmotically-inducible protein OsmY
MEAMTTPLNTQVKNVLHWDLAIPRNAVTVEVADGWVTLRGIVERNYQRESAEADVLRLAGVLGVTNEITIRPTERRA